ncbi:MAG: hypothetical protein ABIP51_19205 [Bacteroidia bacterium]
MNIKKSLLVIERQLNIHFDTDISTPKVKVIKDPEEFFNHYTGIEKKRSLKEMMKLNNEVSFYYEDTDGTVYFKGFRRSGLKSFKILSTTQHHNIADLLHECIHHWQTETNGYGMYNLFDEGCCEITTYVISGVMNQYSDYIDFIQILWNVLDVYTTSPIRKYQYIKKYNIAENKDEISTEYIETFLKKYPSVAPSVNDFIKQVTETKVITNGFNKYCYKISITDILNDLYKVHDFYKEQGELLRVFK